MTRVYKHTFVFYAVLITVGLAVLTLSMALGRSVTGPVFGLSTGQAETDWLILTQIRLPRTLLLLVCGAVLGMAGALLQGLLRNPLAEPGVLGTSSSAALGSVLAIYFFTGFSNPFLISVAGIIGASVSLAVLYQMAIRQSTMSTVILAGVAINALSAALISLALNLAPDPFAATEIMTWLMGSVADREMRLIVWILPFVAIGVVFMLLCAPALNALSLGEATAASLGIHLKRAQLFGIGGAGIAVGACCSISGNIAFVGLIVPHLVRPFFQTPGQLMLPSALAGVVLLTLADCLIRLMPMGPEIKLGVLTALLGVPFFIYLVMSMRERYA